MIRTVTRARRSRPHPNPDAAGEPPLCVDLDGTLLRSNILLEALLALAARSPLTLLRLPFWLLKGKAYLKEAVARRVHLDPRLLPYHSEFLAYLREQHASGRQLVLATASHRRLVEPIAAHLGIFTAVVATDSAVNLSGKAKASRLAEDFGVRQFDYAGNERKDRHVWAVARRAILVNGSEHLRRDIERRLPLDAYFPPSGGWMAYLRAMRPHQWLKNALVFVPLVAAHKVLEFPFLLAAILAFVAFGLCASSVYILNDLLDLPADRQHPRKRERPFASGSADLGRGLVLLVVLLAAAMLVSLSLPPLFGLSLLVYYLFTIAYSLWAKARVVVDVMVLAGLYSIRILAGGAAVAIAPSFWLLAFSMFLFLSLALVKRYSELVSAVPAGQSGARGRGYEKSDLPVLQSLGTASGYLAVLVLALYINSPDIAKLYRTPEAIWTLCPLLLFWISRVWLKAQRGEMHDDPVVFAIRDRQSQLIGGLSIAVMLLAS